MLSQFTTPIRRFLANQWVREISPQVAYPSSHFTEHLASETIATPELARMPLAEPCRHLTSGVYATCAGYSGCFPKVLYYPDQNLILTGNREAIIPDNHGRIRPEYYHWKPFLGQKIKRLSGWFTSLRSFRWSYYQTLVDQVPLLHVLGYAIDDINEPVRLVYQAPLTAAEKYFIVPRLPDGVTLCPLERGTIYQLENYVYASYLSHRYSGYLPESYLKPFLKDFLPNRQATKNRKIYISRALAKKGRHIINEEALLEVLRPLGFESFRLETLPIAEQIELFYDAACVVGPHGAGLTNVMFCEDVDVFELFGQTVLWPHYFFVSKSRNLRYHYQCGTLKGRHSSFKVDIDQLVPRIKRALNF